MAIKNIIFIKDKDFKLLLLKLLSLKHEENIIEIEEWLEKYALDAIKNFDDENNKLYFIKIIFSLCIKSKKYNIMENIRQLLREGVTQ